MSRHRHRHHHHHQSLHLSLLMVALSLVGLLAVYLAFEHVGQFVEFSHRKIQAQYAEVSTTSLPFDFPTLTQGDEVHVPILVYHVIRPSYEDDSAEVKAIAHTPETFDAQLLYLRSAGYHVISLSQLENHFSLGVPLPSKPIVITFDDGWKDQMMYAFPILNKYHYPATFFVFTNAIGRKAFLSWSDIDTIRKEGYTIGSHTRSHPYLTHVSDPAALADEIAGSKRVLEAHLHTPITQFAYPFGQYNATIVDMVRKAGYASARGDFYSGAQSQAIRFHWSAINTPTTLATFMQAFP